ncbi:MAG: exodeoxyribonuclease VII small subunit [Alphaproteobacteria bacterium]|nr:exodeoxyribonuclease VII small subunit [Alphaproteobacteria bacterium]
MTKPAENIEKMSFEAALSELETIVRAMESGQTPLEESITAYERGMALKKHCETRLKDARLRVEKINLSADGTATGASPFNPEQ